MGIQIASTGVRALVGWILGCILLPSPVCAQKVKIEVNPSADLSRVHRYEWRTHPLFIKYPELKEQYSVAIQLVMGAANQQLMKKGVQPVESSPDVYLTFFVGAKEIQKTRTDIVDTWGGWYGWYAPPVWTVTSTEQYIDGMLVMDMVDPRTSELTWRAYCWDSIRDMRNRHKNIESAVRKAFNHFPPKQKQ
jgi:hypothetical protein